MSRPSWDEYFLGVMDAVAKRATCDRGRSGAIIVKDKKILTTGYVGSPSGLRHCDEVGHLMITIKWPDGTSSSHCDRTLHAEENAILQAAEFGISIKGATLYCKMTPCTRCARRIIRVGIVRVVAKKRYHKEQETIEMFLESGIQLNIFEDEIEKYEDQGKETKDG